MFAKKSERVVRGTACSKNEGAQPPLDVGGQAPPGPNKGRKVLAKPEKAVWERGGKLMWNKNQVMGEGKIF